MPNTITNRGNSLQNVQNTAITDNPVFKVKIKSLANNYEQSANNTEEQKREFRVGDEITGKISGKNTSITGKIVKIDKTENYILVIDKKTNKKFKIDLSSVKLVNDEDSKNDIALTFTPESKLMSYKQFLNETWSQTPPTGYYKPLSSLDTNVKKNVIFRINDKYSLLLKEYINNNFDIKHLDIVDNFIADVSSSELTDQVKSTIDTMRKITLKQYFINNEVLLFKFSGLINYGNSYIVAAQNNKDFNKNKIIWQSLKEDFELYGNYIELI